MKIVRQYDGDLNKLGKAERYCLELMTVPRLQERLECMLFLHEYNERVVLLKKVRHFCRVRL